jgi:hypothetical protein
MKWIKTIRALVLATLVALAVLAASATAAQAQGASITVDPIGTFDAQSGTATLTGTFACGDASGFAFIEVVLRQPVGRVSTVSGSAFAEIAACTPGATGTWTATVSPSNGQFRGGRASASARLVVDGTAIAETSQTVQLRG